jgi:hypothetical protein
MSGPLAKRDATVERNKRYLALGVTGAGAALITLAGAPILGGIAVVGGLYLGWDWFKFRAKKGMRF